MMASVVHEGQQQEFRLLDPLDSAVGKFGRQSARADAIHDKALLPKTHGGLDHHLDAIHFDLPGRLQFVVRRLYAGQPGALGLGDELGPGLRHGPGDDGPIERDDNRFPESGARPDLIRELRFCVFVGESPAFARRFQVHGEVRRQIVGQDGLLTGGEGQSAWAGVGAGGRKTTVLLFDVPR